MQSISLDTPLNILLLCFWQAIWSRPDRSAYFNRYLRPVVLIADAVLLPLQGLLRFVPGRVLAAVLFLLLLAGRAALLTLAARWDLGIGLLGSSARHEGAEAALIASLLSFALFLFMFWCLALLYAAPPGRTGGDSRFETLHRLARPFTSLPTWLRPPALIALGMLLACAVLLRANEFPAFASAGAARGAAWCLLVSLSGWVASLGVLESALVLLIIGSWVAMFAGSQPIFVFCHEWLDFLLGPLRAFPLRLGPLDLTPLLFMFALGAVRAVLSQALYRALASLS
jgi:uncharacterized protein YggT (Ycf19 family)